ACCHTVYVSLKSHAPRPGEFLARSGARSFAWFLPSARHALALRIPPSPTPCPHKEGRGACPVRFLPSFWGKERRPQVGRKGVLLDSAATNELRQLARPAKRSKRASAPGLRPPSGRAARRSRQAARSPRRLRVSRAPHSSRREWARRCCEPGSRRRA